jgi:hypothetical protein
MAIIYLDQPLPVGSALRQATYPPEERLRAARTRAECPAYLVLQAVGFALPAPSPTPRCALTAPFHRYPALICLGYSAAVGCDDSILCRTSNCCRAESNKCWAVYFLWHFPAGRPGWPLATTVPCPARTFLRLAKKPATARPTLFIYY